MDVWARLPLCTAQPSWSTSPQRYLNCSGVLGTGLPGLGTEHLPGAQKYICMWNNSHRKPTGDWQKISHTSKAARKSPPNQVIVYQPWQLCFRMPAGQTWRQAVEQYYT